MEKYLMLGAGLAFAAAVQPGPFQAYLINETLTRGWRRTLPAVFGPIISDAPIIVITLLLLSRVPGHLVRYLHLFGGLFLFYLAWCAFRSWRQVEEARLDPATSGPQTLFKAALVNFLNPNPWLGWSLVMGPLFLEGMDSSPLHGLALIVGFYTTMTASLGGLIFLVSQAGRLGSGVRRVTLGLSVLALALFGGYQLWLAVSGS